MKLFDLRTAAKNTPDSPWREVLSPDVLLTAKGCYVIILVALIWFGIGVLGLIKTVMGG